MDVSAVTQSLCVAPLSRLCDCAACARCLCLSVYRPACFTMSSRVCGGCRWQEVCAAALMRPAVLVSANQGLPVSRGACFTFPRPCSTLASFSLHSSPLAASHAVPLLLTLLLSGVCVCVSHSLVDVTRRGATFDPTRTRHGGRFFQLCKRCKLIFEGVCQ